MARNADSGGHKDGCSLVAVALTLCGETDGHRTGCKTMLGMVSFHFQFHEEEIGGFLFNVSQMYIEDHTMYHTFAQENEVEDDVCVVPDFIDDEDMNREVDVHDLVPADRQSCQDAEAEVEENEEQVFYYHSSLF
jgi:hypothetical protein